MIFDDTPDNISYEPKFRALLDKQTQMLASLATLVALGRVDNDGCVECEHLDNFIKRYS